MTAYYNEHDPKAAAWLRELMRAGHIMDGVVDDRSIADVRPADLVGFDRCHFFAGIGGWDYALQLAGWPHGEPVWTGSCPCQPFSAAGRGRGARDARHLWPEFHRLIAECRPAVVFGEQVASALGRTWLAAVRADLEELGYGVGAADLCAAGVGAPHIRQRIYWVAESEHTGSSRAGVGAQSQSAQFQSCDGSGEEGAAAGGMADRDGARRGARRAGEAGDGRDAPREQLAGFCPTDRPADANAAGRGELGRGGVLDGLGEASGDDADGCGAVQRLADPVLAGRAEGRAESGERPAPGSGESGGVGDTDQPVPQGRKQRGDGAGERAAGAPGVASPWADLEWLPCRDGKARPTQPGLFPLAHGVPGRVGLLRGAGNAIVPQVAAAFIEAYRETQRRPY